MAKRKDIAEVCPVKTAVDVVGGRWKPMIVYALREGTKRFSDLRRAIPEVTQQMLTQQLRQLEADGVINRKVYAVVPPKVEYSLTQMGRELDPIFDLLERWGQGVLAHQERKEAVHRTGGISRPIVSE